MSSLNRPVNYLRGNFEQIFPIINCHNHITFFFFFKLLFSKKNNNQDSIKIFGRTQFVFLILSALCLYGASRWYENLLRELETNEDYVFVNNHDYYETRTKNFNEIWITKIIKDLLKFAVKILLFLLKKIYNNLLELTIRVKNFVIDYYNKSQEKDIQEKRYLFDDRLTNYGLFVVSLAKFRISVIVESALNLPTVFVIMIAFFYYLFVHRGFFK